MSEPPIEELLVAWVEKVCQSTGIDRSVVDVDAVLDLAGDAAHGIARPAAPLTTFMAGYLAGRSSSSGASASATASPSVATGSVATSASAGASVDAIAEIRSLIPGST